MRNSFMRQFFNLFLVAPFAYGVHAEIHTLSLREAVDRALHQNPDIALARLDEQKAAQAARLAKAPFTPSILSCPLLDQPAKVCCSRTTPSTPPQP